MLLMPNAVLTDMKRIVEFVPTGREFEVTPHVVIQFARLFLFKEIITASELAETFDWVRGLYKEKRTASDDPLTIQAIDEAWADLTARHPEPLAGQ